MAVTIASVIHKKLLKTSKYHSVLFVVLTTRKKGIFVCFCNRQTGSKEECLCVSATVKNLTKTIKG
ncbi:hypothetical protein ckin8_08560 [Helicobacter pylori]